MAVPQQVVPIELENSIDDPVVAHHQYVTSLKLPPFWTSKPDVWFTQVEAQFNVARITSDRKKYDYIISNLPMDIINNVYDIIVAPPTTNLYNVLKGTIIARLSSSEEKRLDDLLSGSQMGDKKPSDFYRFMLGIVGGSDMVSQATLIKLWKRRLPKTIYIAITASGKTEIQDIIDIADKIWESCQSTVISSFQSNVSPVTVPDSVSSTSLSDLSNKFNTFSTDFQITLNQILLRQVSLEAQLSSLQSNNRSLRDTNHQSRPPTSFTSHECASCHNRRRTRSRSSSSRNKFDPSNDTICYYHQVWKDKAFKCSGPWCVFHNTPLRSNTNIRGNRKN